MGQLKDISLPKAVQVCTDYCYMSSGEEGNGDWEMKLLMIHESHLQNWCLYLFVIHEFLFLNSCLYVFVIHEFLYAANMLVEGESYNDTSE